MVDEVPGKLTEENPGSGEEIWCHVVWPTYRRAGKKDRILNASILIGPDGEIIGIYDKTHPFPWRTEGIWGLD